MTQDAPPAEPTAVMLVLEGHAPYLRQHGRSGAGEEPLHELIASTYAPLLAGLYELIDSGLPIKLALALSPLLLDQLADPVVQKHTIQSLEAMAGRAQADVRRWQAEGNDHAVYLARFYAQLHLRTLQIFERQFGRNLVAATRMLAEAGVIEVVAHTATNAAIPRCERAMLRVQLEVGLISTLRHLGQRPAVLWAANDALTPQLVDLLPELKLRGIVGSPMMSAEHVPPSWVDRGRRVWALTPDNRLLAHIRSASTGYPGDSIYRSDRRDPFSGERYWRRSDDGAGEEWYDPFHAYGRARQHAQHFIHVLRDEAATESVRRSGQALVVAAEMELFGGGWFEGAVWLRTLLEELAREPSLRLTSPGAYVERHPPAQMQLPVRFETPVVDGALWSATHRLREAVERFPGAAGERERLLNQAARELLLAQSNDWQQLHSTRLGSYGKQRLASHLARFDRLLALGEQDLLTPPQRAELAELEEQDNPFPFLNYRLFGGG